MGKVKYKKIPEELLKMATSGEEGNSKTRSSLNHSMEVTEHYKIDIDKLIPYKNQARKGFNQQEIENLAVSLKEHGIRQPLTVIQSKQDGTKYEVVSGERRLRAAKIAEINKVPCIIISDYILAEEIALVENIQRQDLHPIELGEAFLNILKTRDGLTQKALADKLGVSNKLISETIGYTKLPTEIKEIILARNIVGRDYLRKIIASSTPLSFLNSKPSADSRDESDKSLSVLRIMLKSKKFHLQFNNLKKLNDEEKEKLKSLLKKLYESIQ